MKCSDLDGAWRHSRRNSYQRWADKRFKYLRWLCLFLSFLFTVAHIDSALARTKKTPIPLSFFGMEVNNASGKPDCQICTPFTPITGKFGALRIWDSGVKWEEIETSRGVYNWTPLDQILDKAAAANVDVTYVFGTLAPWASPSNTLPLATPSDWTDFVKALVAHAAGRIKYWEIWNEPGGQGRDPLKILNDIVIPAYKIIKADPNHLMVTSPADAIGVIGGSNDGSDWMRTYLALGGGKYADVMAIHQYPPTGQTSAESIQTALSMFQAAFLDGGVGDKPLWGTEGSFGHWTGIGQPTTAQAAYVAKQAILLWSSGLARNYWYGYDNKAYGTLCTVQGIHCNPVALVSGGAYLQSFNWFSNAWITTPCQQVGTVWTCVIGREGNYSGLMVWKSAGSSSFPIPRKYTSYCSLDGTYQSEVSGSTTIGVAPILLETSRTAC